MTTALVLGIIGLAAGASSGLLGSLIDDKNAREAAARQKAQVEAMYKLAVEDANQKFEAAKEQANRNAKQQELQAELTDKSLDITEQGLSNDFNAAIDQMYLSQTSDTMNWNATKMQQGSAEGASYANIASSGVRAGSSLSDAVLMESTVNASQLQFSQNAKRRSDDNNLASVLNNLAGNKWNIQQNRIGADIMREDAAYLRASYEEGGRNYNLYQNQLEQLKKTKNYQTTELDYEYEKHSGWNSFMNSQIAMLSMGTKGFSTGYNFGDTWSKGMKS